MSREPVYRVANLFPVPNQSFPTPLGDRPEWLERRPPPRPPHWEEVLEYTPSEELWAVLELAVQLGDPLLITGEPGCGKTQLAFYAARRLGLGRPEVFHVKASSRAKDLLYTFDTIAYFHAANHSSDATLKARDFLKEGPLWLALEAELPRVLLIDEIDKAPRDFPNDLLHELDQLSFTVPELGHEGRPLRSPPQRPIVIITSNSEQRLPDAFLRRCVYHHIELTPEFLEQVLRDRAKHWKLSEELRTLILERFLRVRACELRKPPGTAELLRWASALAQLTGLSAKQLESIPAHKLPFKELLLKTREDLERVADRGDL